MEEYLTLEQVVKGLNERNIRSLLIGRQAVMLYGAPLLSFDYDFWIHPGDKGKAYAYLEGYLGLDPSCKENEKKPLVIFYGEENKIDVFFVKKITNRKNITLDIDELLDRATTLCPSPDIFILLPSIGDLIELKKITRQTKEEDRKDAEDIAYLEAIKKLFGETEIINPPRGDYDRPDR